MVDSLKIITAGISGITVTWIEWLPVVVRVFVGIATFIYICVKTYKEINLHFNKKNTCIIKKKYVEQKHENL